MKKYMLVLPFALCACRLNAPTVDFLYSGAGGAVYEAKCNGYRHTMGECYQLANQTCFGKFEVLNKSEKTFSDTFFDGDAVSDVATKIKRNLIFYCKN
ncbi:MAG: hypothetical protein IJS26_05025 [Alphaproteobacteria bacterium]|nr:hypothetical protein [Alphaproteobacteria bacterium]